MLAVPTDCPQRDERLGWTGDIRRSPPPPRSTWTRPASSASSADAARQPARQRRLHRRRARHLLRRRHRGLGRRGRDRPLHAVAALRRPAGPDAHFDAMTRWVDYLQNSSQRPDPRPTAATATGSTSTTTRAADLISTAFFAYAAPPGPPGRGDRQGRTPPPTGPSRQIKSAFTEPLRRRRRHGRSGNPDRLRARARVRPPAGQPEAAGGQRSPRSRRRGGHLTVGFLGVEFLLPVLADNGRADIAYQILSRLLPGWGYMLGRGATTIWERWDGIRTDGRSGRRDELLQPLRPRARSATSFTRSAASRPPARLPVAAGRAVHPRELTSASSAVKTSLRRGEDRVVAVTRPAGWAIDVDVPVNARGEVHAPIADGQQPGTRARPRTSSPASPTKARPGRRRRLSRNRQRTDTRFMTIQWVIAATVDSPVAGTVPATLSLTVGTGITSARSRRASPRTTPPTRRPP